MVSSLPLESAFSKSLLSQSFISISEKNMLYLRFLYRNLILKEGQHACTIFLNHGCGGHRRIKKNINFLNKEEPTLLAAN